MAAQNFLNSKQALIAALVQAELEFKAKLKDTVTDVSSFAVAGAESISFPKLDSFVVEDRGFGQANATDQVLTDSKDLLLLDKNKIVKYIVDSKDDLQTVINTVTEAAKRASSAMGRQIDNDIAAVLEADGRATTTVGVITRDIILEMRETLFDAEAEEDEMVLVVGNDSESELLKIAEFKDHDIYGPNAVIRSGKMGTVYGMDVLRRSGLAAGSYYMYAKSGLAFGWQAAPAMDSQKDIDYGAGSMKYVLDALYGVDSLQRGLKGAAANESALIIKDNN